MDKIDRLYAKASEYCLSFPGTSERESHGSSAFFIDGKKAFVHFRNNHHGDGNIGIWCAAPPGVQQLLTAGNPDVYYVPAYVGHLGWVGVRLDRADGWEEIAAAIGDAYAARAPKKYLAQLADRV
ncbi:MmcQ/YjbR family DNA-binding protein [Paenibacillus sacheonensis]|uniref:MmcQ/YjbR family DNA-binding protein n=1 Tax=Paenibacillus sacheonensis TaxID=742054 RepID=A0A7X5BX60_9BACL|nr:MmcQ/YjbR family DNA-binding protein [Paenibacillus sacheonensis]